VKGGMESYQKRKGKNRILSEGRIKDTKSEIKRPNNCEMRRGVKKVVGGKAGSMKTIKCQGGAGTGL